MQVSRHTARPPAHDRPTNLDRFLFGAAYYPEHWSPADREEDPERMAAAGFNAVRMGEFAWDLMEPAEGRFDFCFFDREIARLGAKGIGTILCTPTATPPRWLTRAHPEVLRVDREGRVLPHGSRQHACHSSPVFREYSRKITEAMAGHFAENPHVIGWQTDNEFHCHFSECYCPACLAGFQQWLAGRYGSVQALNAAWGTAFWAQTYAAFDEVVLPTSRPAYENPSQQLDYFRYLHFAVTQFQREQVEILRRHNPEWFVTHNGVFGHIDYREFSRDLDFLGYDCYPLFWVRDAGPGHTAAGLDRVRSFAGNFLVPEQQSGPGGQRPYLHETPVPGEMRLWAYQSIAHGADGVLHFRWRSCRFGAEEYWCGILDHDNVPRRRYREAACEGQELAKVGAEILGTHVRMDAAILSDVWQDEAHQTLNFGLPSPGQAGEGVHRALWRRKFAVGFMHPDDDFAGARLLVVPHFALVEPELAERLRLYVEGGGVLVVGARTGTRDANNQVVAQTAPGLLTELLGVAVEEYGKVTSAPNMIVLDDGNDVPLHAWYEVLEPRGAEVVGTWESGHYRGLPAITARSAGRGRAYYVGTYLNEENFGGLLGTLALEAGLRPIEEGLPDAVEAVERTDGTRTLLFLLNHSADAVTVPDIAAGVDLLTGEPVAGQEVALDPFGVAIIRRGG